MVKASIRKSVSASGNSGILDGHIRKSQPANHEQLEIQMYLSKLRQLVPNMPKNRKVSKVEVINNVIDYICDLQTALIDQLHPSATSASATVSINNNNNNNNCLQALMMESSPSADCPTC